MVFVGVHERVLTRGAPGTLGVRRADGARALHVLVVNEDAPLKIRSLVFRAIVRGIDGLIRDDEITSYFTNRITVTSARQRTVAVDGELLHLNWPLTYEFLPDAVKLVRPSSPTLPE
jgi:diacylglycerol kinase family enzyme